MFSFDFVDSWMLRECAYGIQLSCVLKWFSVLRTDFVDVDSQLFPGIVNPPSSYFSCKRDSGTHKFLERRTSLSKSTLLRSGSVLQLRLQCILNECSSHSQDVTYLADAEPCYSLLR